jgi:hypothetical protein
MNIVRNVCQSLYLPLADWLYGLHSGANSIETPLSGTIRISVDESFKPVIDSQLKVFGVLFRMPKYW